MAGNPNWVDGWSPEDLELLVRMRDEMNKPWKEIAKDFGRPMGTCYDRYKKATNYTPSPPVIPEPIVIPSLHAELGIRTYVHLQAVLSRPFEGRLTDVSSHLYRMPVTLAKVFA